MNDLQRFWYSRKLGVMVATLHWLSAVRRTGRILQSGENTQNALAARYGTSPTYIYLTVRALCEAGLIDHYCPGYEGLPR